MDPELNKSPKSEQDLIDILKKYPNVSVYEDFGNNIYVIVEEHEENSFKVKHSLTISEIANFRTNTYNPSISHRNQDRKQWIYIEFTPDDMMAQLLEYGEGSADDLKYEEIHETLKFAKEGLEIMDVFRRIPTEERNAIMDKYFSRIATTQEDINPNEPYDLITLTLEGINEALEIE